MGDAMRPHDALTLSIRLNLPEVTADAMQQYRDLADETILLAPYYDSNMAQHIAMMALVVVLAEELAEMQKLADAPPVEIE